MDILTLLKTLCAPPGVSGLEQAATQVALELMAPLGKTSVTPLGSVLCIVKEPKEGYPHVMLEAHLDQIGMIVTGMEEGGFVRIAPCGGVDRRILPASVVTLHGKQPLKGIVTSTPPHLQESDAAFLPVEELFVDTGYTKEALEELVSLGDRITLDGTFHTMENGLIVSPALDDRCGCAAIIAAAGLLKDAAIDVGISISLSVMEEVYGGGAGSAAFILKPTHSITVDVSHGYTPDSQRHRCGELKQGVMVGFSPALNYEMSKQFMEIAKRENIPCQPEIMSGSTGTFADQIAFTAGGIKAGLLSVPLRYMHTSVEMIALSDVTAVVELIERFILTQMGGKLC